MNDRSKHRPSRARRMVFTALCVLISVLALEGILQGAALLSPQVAAVLDRHAGLLLPDTTLIHRPNPAYPDHDEWGYRNETVPDRAFAVALGDSQTYGAMVPRANTWPQQLGDAIGEPVYNMAFGGYGAGEASVLLDKALQLKPKWILFGLYAGNDLFDAYELAYKTEAMAELRTDDRDTFDAITAAESDGAIESAFRETTSARASLKQWFGEHCKLYGLARAARNTARGSAWQESEPDWDTILTQQELHPEWVLFENKTSPTVLTPEYRLLALNREDPRIREGERISLTLIANMADRCARDGVQFAVVALPTKEFVHQDVVLAAGGDVDNTLNQLWRDESAFWDVCETACTENKTVFINTLAQLRASLHAGDRPFRRDADGHLTTRGNRVVRDAIHERIAR